MFLNYFGQQSLLNIYAVKKYKYGDNSFSVTPEEIYKVIAVLLLSGYNTLPNTRMYWETKGDVLNACVSNTISRDNF